METGQEEHFKHSSPLPTDTFQPFVGYPQRVSMPDRIDNTSSTL